MTDSWLLPSVAARRAAGTASAGQADSPVASNIGMSGSSSPMDAISERYVMRGLERLMNGRTVFIIALSAMALASACQITLT